MSWNCPPSSGRTRIGWSTPTSRIDAVSSLSVSSSKDDRGWWGLGSMLATGSSW